MIQLSFDVKALTVANDGVDWWVAGLRETPLTTTKIAERMVNYIFADPTCEKNAAAVMALMLATALQRLARPD